MNIQNRMDSSLMMDRAVRKERQKLRPDGWFPSQFLYHILPFSAFHGFQSRTDLR